jgi:hypothetical protein
MKNTIKTVNLEEIATTQAKKIASAGFGSKKDCYEYLNSSSLSILNEKCIAFIYDTLNNGFNQIEFKSGINSLTLNVNTFNKCMNIVTIQGTFTLCNCKQLTKYDYTGAHITIKITLPKSNKKQDITPHKYMGNVKRIKYGDTYYNAYPYSIGITE